MKATLNRPDGSVLHVEGNVAEIAQLFLQAPGQVHVKSVPPAPAKRSGKREMSEETREKIRKAAKLRWSKVGKGKPKK